MIRMQSTRSKNFLVGAGLSVSHVERLARIGKMIETRARVRAARTGRREPGR